MHDISSAKTDMVCMVCLLLGHGMHGMSYIRTYGMSYIITNVVCMVCCGMHGMSSF